MKKFLMLFAFLATGTLLAAAAVPGKVTAITYFCKYDKSQQPALIYLPENAKGLRPLVVVLHTWSASFGQCKKYGNHVSKYGAYMNAPIFRGSNNKGNKLSMGSDAAVSDIIDAVEYMKKNHPIDPDRIYLIGGSGGGHMSLLTASRSPEIWAGVASFCPITDLVRWHDEKAGKGYGSHIARIVGDMKTPAARKEALHRSPVTYLANLKAPVSIISGVYDRLVSVSHSMRGFNIIAAEADRFPEKDILFIAKNRKAPAGYPQIKEKLGKKKILVRRVSGNIRLILTNGGHDIMPAVGIQWLMHQRKGKPADFSVGGAGGEAEALGR